MSQQLLEEMAVDHPYYCSETNYYANDAGLVYASMTSFLDEFKNADVDMNLVFRWDIKVGRDDDYEDVPGTYRAEVFMMQQRKGRFTPIQIESVTADEVEAFREYLLEHRARLDELWQPL